MKNFYFKTSSYLEIFEKAFVYKIHFSKIYLSPGEKGLGKYVAIKAKSEKEIDELIENNELIPIIEGKLTIFIDPIGE